MACKSPVKNSNTDFLYVSSVTHHTHFALEASMLNKHEIQYFYGQKRKPAI